MWVSELSCGGRAFLTTMAAMQSSVVSFVVHSKMPPLTIVHSLHLALSWWPTAHHFTVCEPFPPRTSREEPGIQRKLQGGFGSLVPPATEWLSNEVLIDIRRVTCPYHHSLLPIPLRRNGNSVLRKSSEGRATLTSLLTSPSQASPPQGRPLSSLLQDWVLPSRERSPGSSHVFCSRWACLLSCCPVFAHHGMPTSNAVAL